MPASGKNQQTIREENRALLLRLICTEQSISRVALARRTGLSKMAVGNIIADLMESGLVREGDSLSGGRGAGRRAVGLFPGDRALAAGVYISRDHVTASLISLSARVLKSLRYPLSAGDDASSVVDKVCRGIDEVTAGVAADRLLGVGVASIGPVDVTEGVLLTPNDFYGIGELPLKDVISQRTGLDVTVDNDMNAAAMAESLFGLGRDHASFIYLGITHGVGSGVVLNGRVYYGEEGFAGEIGHTVLEVSGEPCTCGNRGCFEAYVSIPRLLEYTRARLESGEDSVLSSIPGFDFGDICQNAPTDALCSKVLDRLVLYTGAALTNAVNVFDVCEVVLGHDVAAGGRALARRLEEHINGRLFARRRKRRVGVEISAFGDAAPAVGSGMLAFAKLFGLR